MKFTAGSEAGRPWQHRRWQLLGVLLVGLAGATSALAQDNNYAAGYLLQPVGARVVGHGEAAVADTALGTEGLWWNPAGLARMRQREIAVHHTQGFTAQTELLSAAIPSSALGTLAMFLYYVNYGTDEGRGGQGEYLGQRTNRVYIVGASYATPITKRLSAGVTAKRLLVRNICSACAASAFPSIIGNANAVDVGAQFILPVKIPMTIGGSVRNLGQSMQFKDKDQADPLPRVVQVGVQASVPIPALQKNMASLDVRGDVLMSPAYASQSFRVGADLSYKDLYTLRVGYKQLGPNDGSEAGLTAGVGLRYNALQLDIARRFDATSSLGESAAPTYVSLRYRF